MRLLYASLIVVLFAACASQKPRHKPLSAKTNSMRVNSLQSTTVHLAWNPAVSMNPIVRYDLYDKYWDGQTTRTSTKALTTNNVTYTAGWGLHIFYVVAINSLGMPSPPSKLLRVSSQ